MRAQLLEARRPSELVALVQRLTLLQIDPTAAVAPSADLVAWSRLGSSYQSDHLKQALERDRTLVEHDARVRPMSDLGLYLAGADAWPHYEKQRAWLRTNARFRRGVLHLLGSSGPLTSRGIPDTIGQAADLKPPGLRTHTQSGRNRKAPVYLPRLGDRLPLDGRAGAA